MHHHIPLTDSPTAPLLDLLPQITTWLFRALHDNAEVDDPRALVHCEFGVSRAPSAVIGYLMATQDMSFREGIRMVQEKRGKVCLNLGFIRGLSRWAEVKGEWWRDGLPIEKGTALGKPVQSMLEIGEVVDGVQGQASSSASASDVVERQAAGKSEGTAAGGLRPGLQKLEKRASVILLEKKAEWEQMKKRKGWRRLRCW